MASELALEAQNEEVDVKQPPMTAQEMAQHAHESLRTMAQRLQTTAAAAARSPAGRFIGGAAAEAARHCGDRARTALAKLSRGDDEDRWRHADAITRGERWLTLTWYESAGRGGQKMIMYKWRRGRLRGGSAGRQGAAAVATE